MFCEQDIFIQVNPQDQFLINEAQTPLLQNTFTLNEASINLILTNSYIILTQANNSNLAFYCPLNFSIKFDVLRSQWKDQRTPGTPFGFCLEKQNSQFKIQFLSNSSTIIDIWAKELQKKVNQRNFHKLFKAKRKIGKGAFATVYLAQRLVDGKMVAVKAFSKQKQYAGDKGRQSLQNQIKIMRLLDHPNIMKLQGIYETDNSIYVILEYLQGQQLNEDLKNKKVFLQTEIQFLVKGLLSGLSHMNQKRIIHRDLKPQNIMFRRKDSLELAICDFGLATQADEQKYLFVRCGTPGFVAPQIINIKNMASKSQPISDVFSAGIIFHYLLLNKSIFDGTRYSDILAQNRACQFNFAKQEYQSLDKKALDLLTKMLQKTPQLRISALEAMKHPYFNKNIDSAMEIEEAKIQYPKDLFKQKDIQNIQTPSTFRESKRSPNLRKKNSSPMSKEKNDGSFYVRKQKKENYPVGMGLTKKVSNTSGTKRSQSRGKQNNKMVDEIDENK